MSLRRYSSEDPFSAEFETHVEDAMSDTEIAQERPEFPPVAAKPKPVLQPKPSKPLDSFAGSNPQPFGATAAQVHGHPRGAAGHVPASRAPFTKEDSQDPEYWPPPPEDLDQFGAEATPAAKAGCLQKSEHEIHDDQGEYPEFISRVNGFARSEADDSEDSWSTTCDQGSRLSIVDEAAEPSLPPILTRQTPAERARARSEVIRSRKRPQYDNCDAMSFPAASPSIARQLPSAEPPPAPRTKSLGAFQYENVALPHEILGAALQRELETSSPRNHSDRSSGGSVDTTATVALSAYENVFITEDQRVSIAQNGARGRPRGSSSSGAGGEGDDDDDSEGLDALSETDSYYTDSDFDCDSGEEIQDFLNDTLSPSVSECSSQAEHETADERRRNVVRQVLEMERNYVRKLHFMCRVVMVNLRVLQKIPGVACIPPETQKQIFLNLDVIFNFHAQNLLPALEDMISNWDSQPGLGKVFKRLVPYFRLYTDFHEGHKQALVQYDSWLKKNAVFAALIEEVQRLPECGRLSIREILVEISNQVPKYEVALKELSDLSHSQSPDTNDLVDAVEILNQTCCDLAKAMGKEDRIKVLREVQSRLDITYNIVKATRELKHETKIQTVHPGNGRLLDRHIFLFNDLLLLCGPRLMSGKHEVRFKLENQTLNLYEGDNLTVRYTFYIQSESKAFECACRTGAEKYGLMKIIQTEVEGSKQWSLYGRVMFKEPSNNTTDPNVGKMKPEMQPAGSGAQSCTLCDTAMSALRRRYHCMACGKIVCAKCSQQKAPLEYDGRRQSKVCDACYAVIHARELSSGTSTLDLAHYKVQAQDPGHISGYLRLSATKGKSWRRRWFLVKTDGIMYCFKQHTSDEVWSFLPLGRFTVSPTSKADPVYKSTCFKLVSSRRSYYLQSDTADSMKTWLDTLATFCDSTA